MKYEKWLTEWLECYVKPTTKERTYKKYQRQIENHILSDLGALDMKMLTAATLQRFTITLSEKGLAANTVNGILSVLKMSLRKAAFLGKVDREYTSLIVSPKTREKRTECFSKSEQRKIEIYIAQMKKTKLFGIVLCLYTGLRIGELLALEWSDIDLQKGVIYVSKSCHDSWQNGRYIKTIDTPKTNSSLRTIPFPKQLLKVFKELRKTSNDGYIIGNEFPYGVQVRSYQKTFQRLLKRLNLPHKGFHSLRHTFATRALECGMDIQTLSEILGHQNSAITLKRYAHSMLEHKIEMMNRIGKLLV